MLKSATFFDAASRNPCLDCLKKDSSIQNQAYLDEIQQNQRTLANARSQYPGCGGAAREGSALWPDWSFASTAARK
jgi:hypothetical protein